MASNLVQMMKDRKFGVMVGVAAVAAVVGSAQMHKVAKPEQVVRAIGVYEWTGDLSKPKASRLVPVSIFIDGELQDAGVYVARPVPFALLTGNVYELDDAGLTKGTVELSYARHVQATDSEGDSLFEDGWLGYGDYHAPPLTATAARLRQSKTLPVITTSGGDTGKPKLTDKSGSGSSGTSSSGTGSSGTGSSDDPDRPTMKRRDSGSGGSASGGSSSGGNGSAGSGSSGNGSGSGSANGSGNSSGNGSGSGSAGSASADDPDRPTMKRHTDTDTTASSGGDSGSGSSDNDPNRPTLKRRSPGDTKNSQKDTASVRSAGSLNDDPDRPTLHHQVAASEKSLSELRGIPTDMHQMVAVSDAKNREPHVYARPWLDDTERAMVLAKMQAFARAQLAGYKTPPGGSVSVASAGSASSRTTSHSTTQAAASTDSASAVMAKAEQDPGAPTLKRGVPQQVKTQQQSDQQGAASSQTTTAAKTATPAKTTTTAASHTKRVAKPAGPAPVALLDEDLRGYLLSYGGAPTFVYTAHTEGTGSALRYVTVVAQDNGISSDGSGGLGELKLALASVTDEAHLDRTPRLRLVDAVDAEASNRASLLFELRGARSRQFALYRVIATKPEQIFVTGTTE